QSRQARSARLLSALVVAFPAESSSSRQSERGRDRAVSIALFFVSGAVFAPCAPGGFTKLWAGHGGVLSRACTRTPGGTLVSVYRGYLAFLPRVFATLIAQSPAKWWAAETAIAAIAATAWTASITYLGARWYIPQRALCALLGLSVSLVPALRTESIN